jgi:hypothetical protein
MLLVESPAAQRSTRAFFVKRHPRLLLSEAHLGKNLKFLKAVAALRGRVAAARGAIDGSQVA